MEKKIDMGPVTIDQAERIADALEDQRIAAVNVPRTTGGSRLLVFMQERQRADEARSEAQIAADERDALRDMLEDARAELAQIREALGVALEPHQSIQERTLDAARAARAINRMWDGPGNKTRG
jgi:hypothetical protein